MSQTKSDINQLNGKWVSVGVENFENYLIAIGE